MQKEKASASNYNDFCILSRTELGENIDKVTKTYPNINTLVHGLFTPRPDTNAPLETRSELRYGSQVETTTAKNTPAQYKDETAK